MRKLIILIWILSTVIIGCGQKQTRSDDKTLSSLSNQTSIDSSTEAGMEDTTDIWDEATMEQAVAEEYFTMAINLISEDYVIDAIEYLKVLIDNKVYDRYVFQNLLSVYAQLIPQYEMYGNETDLLNLINEAVTYSELAVDKFPEDTDILYGYAEIVRYANDADKFYEALEDLLELNPNDIYANYFSGALHYFNNELEEATPYLQNVIANADMTDYYELTLMYNSLDYLGMISITLYDYESAIMYMEMAKELDSSNYEILQYLGLLYASFLDFDDALDNFNTIPEVYLTEELAEIFTGVLVVKQLGDLPQSKPNSTGKSNLQSLIDNYRYESSYIQGVYHYMREEYNDALDELSLNLFQDYSIFYQYYLKYLIYKDMGDTNKMITQSYLAGNIAKQVEKYELAAFFYEMVQKKSNAAPEIYWLIGSLYDDAAEYTNALDYYRKYINYEGQKEYESSALVRMAYLYTVQDDIHNATNIMQNAKNMVEADYEKYVVYYYSGLINMELGLYEQSLSDFYQAQTNATNGFQLTYYIGSILVHLDRIDDAVDILVEARKEEPNSPDINNLLAYTYALKGENLYEAETLINLALLKDPDNIAYLDTLGWIYYQRDELEESYEVFSEVETLITDLEDESGMDEIYYHLGIIYEAMDQDYTAQTYYELGLENNPDNELIQSRLEVLE